MGEKRIILTFILVFLLALPTYSHPGRTDAKGGHTNHSTGEYHYHHGYPEHQHPNGECPYDFIDKTGQNSGGSSSGNKSSTTKTNSTETSTTTTTSSGHTGKKNPELHPLVIPIGSSVAVTYACIKLIQRKKKEKEEAAEKQQKLLIYTQEYNGKEFRSVFNVPYNLKLGADDTPTLRYGPPEGFLVYVTSNGQKYHSPYCKYARYGKPISAWAAAKRMYSPCKLCCPPSYDFSWYRKYIQLKADLKKCNASIKVIDGIIFIEKK